MIPELMTSRARAPRKKFRGRRRYFVGVRRDAEAFEIPRFASGWGLWHYHADWPGWGNLQWAYRKQHLEALALVYGKILDQAATVPAPFQTWIQLSGLDAGLDGVYLHSPNRYNEPYPLEFTPPGPVWNEERLRPLFSELLPGRELRIGRFRLWDERSDVPEERTDFYVQVPGIGDPL